MKKIPLSEPNITDKERKLMVKAIDSGWISSKGSYIQDFEELFAKKIQSNFAISTNNGTSALELALLSLGIGHKDEVIVPNFTFAASINSILNVGATPIVVDTENEEAVICPLRAEKIISPNTKAILCVNLLGHNCDLIKLKKICKANNIYLIEDSAESLGSMIGKKYSGTFGDIGTFSFYGNKIITTGEGGMCVTASKNLAEKMNLIKNHGMSKKKKYWHLEIGRNYRMTNIQAALGLGQIRRLKELIQKRKKAEEIYLDLLKKTSQVFIPKPKYGKKAFWLLNLLLREEFIKERSKLIDYLRKRGIESSPFFVTFDQMPIYRGKCLFSKNLTNSKHFSSSGLFLPMYPHLKESEIAYICKSINNFFKN